MIFLNFDEYDGNWPSVWNYREIISGSEIKFAREIPVWKFKWKFKWFSICRWLTNKNAKSIDFENQSLFSNLSFIENVDNSTCACFIESNNHIDVVAYCRISWLSVSLEKRFQNFYGRCHRDPPLWSMLWWHYVGLN